MRTRRRSPLIDLANNQVPILEVCRWVGMSVPEGTPPRSLKVHCPFGEIAHTDGGIAPALRVYPDTNGAYCFSCGFFSSVWLAASIWNVRQVEAARMLLDRIGYQPVSTAQLWALAQVRPAPDTTALSQALRVFCERTDAAWSRHQFEEQPAEILDRCLALLSYVQTSEQAEEWLCHSKLIMQRVLMQTGR